MSLRTRYALYGLVAVALLALNAWRWWPAAPPAEGEAAHGQAVTEPGRPVGPEDFRLHVVAATAEPGGKPLRNPFVPVPKPAPEQGQPKPKPPAPRASVAPAPEPARRTAADERREAAEAARAALANLKVVGVIVRESGAQAFVLQEDERLLVREGDPIAEDFVVERITTEGIRVSERASRLTEYIPLSGN